METTGGPKIGCPRRGFGPPSVFITGVDNQQEQCQTRSGRFVEEFLALEDKTDLDHTPIASETKKLSGWEYHVCSSPISGRYKFFLRGLGLTTLNFFDNGFTLTSSGFFHWFFLVFFVFSFTAAL